MSRRPGVAVPDFPAFLAIGDTEEPVLWNQASHKEPILGI
eukprot:gene25210-30453_t